VIIETVINAVFYASEEAKQVLRELNIGDKLLLVPEPNNQFDPNAVQVKVLDSEGAELKLGYVPQLGKNKERISERVMAEIVKGNPLEVIFKGGYKIVVQSPGSSKVNFSNLGVF
jgi:precorrin-6B methylase 1